MAVENEGAFGRARIHAAKGVENGLGQAGAELENNTALIDATPRGGAIYVAVLVAGDPGIGANPVRARRILERM